MNRHLQAILLAAAIWAAVNCAQVSLGEVSFFVAPTPASMVPDPKGDLAFQTAVAGPLAEFDLREHAAGYLQEPSPLCAGAVRVRPCVVDDGGRSLADGAGPGTRLVETFVMRPGGAPEATGIADGTFLLNRMQTASGLLRAGAGIEFTFSKPVKAFGTWIMEDFPEANGFVLTVREVGGKTSTSGLLESGNGASLAVEGFLGAVSDVGIEKILVAQRTLDNRPSAGDFFYLDHIQVSRAAGDPDRTTCDDPLPAGTDMNIKGAFFDLMRGGQSAATLVLPESDAVIWSEAAKMITGPTSRWSGGELKIMRLPRNKPLPAGNIVVLGTPQTSSLVEELCNQPLSAVSRVPAVADQGFAVETRASDGSRQLILAGKTPRGAFNAAVFCRDFVLDATPGPAGKADVFVRETSAVRSPRLAVRGTYTLSFYGRAVEYTAEDWMRIVDRFAEDGMNRMNFWLSGHHPSKKYPHLYNVDDPAGQSTKGTKLTVDGVTRLIRHCHDRGVEFFIGGGVFAWCASEQLAKDHPEIRADCPPYYGLCPSKPFARLGTREHFLEMYDTWPEADGFMFEIRDEYGECRCPDCQLKIDEYGSKHYGRAEITWLQEFAREAWKKNPRLRFCWLIGYAEHARDVYYYDQIRRMNDPRFEWLDTRVGLPGPAAGALPGPGGTPRPFTFFSSRIQHWDPFYTMSTEAILASAHKTTEHGLNGYVVAFEPGPWVGSYSYYGDVIPLPVDILPYCLTGLAYRESTWDPGITLAEFRRIVYRRYFSPDVSPQFADDMLYLRQFSLSHWAILRSYGKYGKPKVGPGGRKLEPTIAGQLQRVQALTDETQKKTETAGLLAQLRELVSLRQDLERMAEMERRMREAITQSSPKTRDGFAILQRMIDDTRDLYKEAIPDPVELSKAIQALGG